MTTCLPGVALIFGFSVTVALTVFLCWSVTKNHLMLKIIGSVVSCDRTFHGMTLPPPPLSFSVSLSLPFYLLIDKTPFIFDRLCV